MVRGGSEFLRHNALSEEVARIDREAGGGTSWVSFDNVHVPSLIRMRGIRALTGLHPTPQLDLWARLDPEGSQRSIYNRYASVFFHAFDEADPEFVIQGPYGLRVKIRPYGFPMSELGATHAIVTASRARQFERFSGASLIGGVGKYRLYALPKGARR